MEKIKFKNKDGQSIVGVISKPEGKGPFPAVIICHGFKGDKEQPHLTSIGRSLVNKEIVSLMFDGTNQAGESDGEMLDVSVFHYIDDMKAALDYLETLDFVDSEKLGVVGHSFGSRAGTFLTAEDKRVKCFVPMGLSLRLKEVMIERYGKEAIEEWKKKGWMIIRRNSDPSVSYKVGYQYYEEDNVEEMKNAIKKISVPIFFISGSKDEYISVEDAEEIYFLANEPKELSILEGFPHTWRSEEKCDIIAEIVSSWIKKNL